MSPAILVATADGLRGPDGSAAGLEGRDVVALSEPWAIADGRMLVRESDGGWNDVAGIDGLTGRSVLTRGDDEVLVGTSKARLLRLEGESLTPVPGFDEAPGRDTWFTPWGGPPDTRSMSRSTDGTVYANVHVGGILRSSDEERWGPTIEVESDVHQVLAHPNDPAVVLAACAYGLAISGDQGETWRTDADGLHGRYCRAVAVAGEDVLVSASTGPFTDRAAVYRRPLDTSGPFERCTEGLPEWFPSNVDSGCLAASGAEVVLGSGEGEVYRSNDGGRTWERTATGLPAIRAVLASRRTA
ncbi:MAG: WD40/YVTN/BNR-like repeat-containing protein [Actinomycetota bacterium]